MPSIQRGISFLILLTLPSTLKGDPRCNNLDGFSNCEKCSYTDEKIDNTYSSSSNFTRVKCTGARLKGVPNEFAGVDVLSIAIDKIMMLPTFSNYTKLVKLNMNYDDIRLIEELAFYNLDNLTHLNLSHNYIIDLTPKTFAGLKNLEILCLTSNRIYYVESKAFFGDNVPKLESLFLNQNKIVKVEKRSFMGLSNLVQLDLSSNRIEALEQFAASDGPLSKLTMLNLAFNKINRLPEDFFKFMPKLEQLLLEHNYLTAVSSADFHLLSNSLEILELQSNLISEVKTKCFKDLHRLNKIDLSHNQLTRLSGKTLPEKNEDAIDQAEVTLMLLMFGNPINCSDCDNSWMVADAVLKKVNPPTEALCYSPSTVSFESATTSLFQHCQSPGSSMKTFSLFILFFFVLILLFLALAFALYWLRKRRKQNIPLNLGERAGNSNWASPSNKGAFSYRGLEEQFPCPVDKEDNRL